MVRTLARGLGSLTRSSARVCGSLAQSRAHLAVVSGVLALSTVVGCDAVQRGTIGDDTRQLEVVDAGSLDEVIREVIAECRLALLDAGRIGAPAVIDVCTVTPFYEGCPLRVCVSRLVERVAPQCPPRDAGTETSDSRFCDAVIWPFLPDSP